ncbi:hypothetical protein B0T18DRAFT_150160 [Schizothecium vesticola]|uniref:Uncharacterized protein n=1 Tax=Schizothecium vesticola TaxID=314040 RepID=A0AA40EW25_9PEZI|nr:hypothetical protein B0T18DRAFT_150160 [Schizothecium vesticola]
MAEGSMSASTFHGPLSYQFPQCQSPVPAPRPPTLQYPNLTATSLSPFSPSITERVTPSTIWLSSFHNKCLRIQGTPQPGGFGAHSPTSASVFVLSSLQEPHLEVPTQASRKKGNSTDVWPKYPAQLHLDTPNHSAKIGGTTSLWPFPPNQTKRAH